MLADKKRVHTTDRPVQAIVRYLGSVHGVTARGEHPGARIMNRKGWPKEEGAKSDSRNTL
jgi:hypothetical protein